MGSIKRDFERFDDIGRVESEEICPLTGTLDNISNSGCKVHYNFPVVIDLENDYQLKLIFARAASEGSFVLTCHPQWVKEKEKNTEIGFKFLPCQDYSRLTEYIEKLNFENNDEDIQIELNDSDSTCQLI